MDNTEELIAERLSELSYEKNVPDDPHIELLEDHDSIRMYKVGESHYIVHRGTTPSIKDLTSDFHIAQGRLHHDRQFQERVETTRNLINRLPESANVILTGHSLGGTTATLSMNDPLINSRVNRVIAFAPGTSPFQRRSHFKVPDHKVTVIRRALDPISAFDFPGKTKSRTIRLGIPRFSGVLPFAVFENFLHFSALNHSIS